MEMSLSVIIVLSLALSVSAQNSTVYAPHYGDVFVLNATTIYSNVFNSEKAWLIQFYDCGWRDYCKDYSPYEKFAGDIIEWRNIVVIAAFNCGLPENKATCNAFLVFRSTALRFFPPHSPQHVLSYPVQDTRPSFCDPSHSYYRPCSTTLMNLLSPLCALAQRMRMSGACIPRPRPTLNRGLISKNMDAMFNLKMALIDTLEVHFPKLLEFSNNYGSDTYQLLNNTDELFYPVRPTGVVVIFEGANSYLGKELTLKLSIFKFIKVYRFLSFNNIYHALNLDTWPAAGFIDENGGAHRIDIGQRDWVNTVSKALLDYAGVFLKPEENSTIPLPGANTFARTSNGYFRYPVTPLFKMTPKPSKYISQINVNAEILKNIG